MMVARDGEEETEKLLFNKYRNSVLQDERVLWMDGGDGCIECECT